MKEIWKKKKIFVITIALMVGIIGTAVSYRITCNNGNQRTLINP